MIDGDLGGSHVDYRRHWLKKERKKARVGLFITSINVDIGRFTICEFHGKQNPEFCPGEKTQ